MIANANDTNRTVVGDPNLSCQRSNVTGLPIAHGPVCSICEVRVKATCLRNHEKITRELKHHPARLNAINIRREHFFPSRTGNA